MKNIIILGAGRSGKSTLSKKINEKLNYYIISIDKINTTFQRAYPKFVNQQNDSESGRLGASGLSPFLGHYLGVISSDYQGVKGNRFVLEGCYFDFDIILPILKKYDINELDKKFILIGLFFNKKTADEAFNDIRKYDTEEDWTYQLNDDELRKHCQSAIEWNRKFYVKLKENGFIIYDTSTEREQVLNKIVDDIKLKLV